MVGKKGKKQQKIQKKNDSNELRASVLQELQKFSLKPEHAILMKPTSTSNISKKHKLATANYRTSLGIPLLPEEDKQKQKLSIKRKKALEKRNESMNLDCQNDASSSDESQEIINNSPLKMESTPLKIPQPFKTLVPSNIPTIKDDLKPKHTLPIRKFKYNNIHVNRKSNIIHQRLSLPAIMVENDILESLLQNNIVIISGETGSGKSTQVPQFLYEAGFATNDCIIAVTQPRRIAAISVSRRVGEELDDMDLVGYQVRYDRFYYPDKCRIKFMTDGILMKEIQRDFLCSKYSVIILDEAHERSINCDILIGLLSRIVLLRNDLFQSGKTELPPLKLVIMSATLRLTDFLNNQNLFYTPPPVINIETRSHSVTNHFSRITPDNYLKAAGEKSLQIHKKLPPGSILVFVSASREVQDLCSYLRSQGNVKSSNIDLENKEPIYDDSEADDDYDDFLPKLKKTPNNKIIQSPTNMNSKDLKIMPPTHEFQDNKAVHESKVEQPIDINIFSDDEFITPLGKANTPSAHWLGSDLNGKLSIRPLYASLPAEQQMNAFKPPEPNERVVIVATNIAETSVTIPNVRYIVDTGKEKKRNYIPTSGVSFFTIQWISKASSDQRSGRCGRVGPGHCYRLYSSAVYNDKFQPFPPVNLLQAPLDSTLLFISSLGISHIQSFPFPTPPPPQKVYKASEKLFNLGAITTLKGSNSYFSMNNPITCTRLGLNMATIPIAPQFAKVLLTAASRSGTEKSNLLRYSCILVAYMSVGNTFNHSPSNSSTSSQDSLNKSHFKSDLEYFLCLFSSYIFSNNKPKFCLNNSLNSKNMKEIFLLSTQLFHIIQSKLKIKKERAMTSLSPPNLEQTLFLHDCMLEGSADLIAFRVENNKNDPNIPPNAYRSAELAHGELCYIHPTSVAKIKRPLPEILAYGHIIKGAKNYMIDCFPVDPSILAKLESPLIKRGKFLTLPTPRYLEDSDQFVGFVSPIYFPLEYQLPTIELEIPDTEPLKYRLFAKAIVEGLVFKKLKEYKHLISSDPSTFIIQPNVQQSKFIKALQFKNCGSRSTLITIWKDKPSFLLSEYTQFLKTANYQQLIALQESWPPIN